jgi:asparagine synthetase B (glutamine-hydrolysing)
MCGIFCSVSRHAHIEPSQGVTALLQARGPDASNTKHIRGRDAFLTYHSTVLSLRGSTTTTQPFNKPGSGSTLCWNGEAWSVRGERPDGNDTTRIFDVLQQATCGSGEGTSLTRAAIAVSKGLSEVAGPYGFVFYDDVHSRMYFGRDFLGRRSLLRRVDTHGNLLLTSVTNGASTENWSEVEADGIYCIDLTTRSATGHGPSENDIQRWGDFTVVKVPYQHIDAQSNITQSVGTPRSP